ncbi:MAG: glycogen synthase [Treponema sp.]|jgi:starch synthase|nr:glycogen synthase [Treponema sp.]
MKILMVASEAVPFAKTGGLADMVSALSLVLARLGHEVRMVIPRYYGINKTKLQQLEGPLGVPVGGHEEWSAVYTTDLPGSPPENPIPVYFIDHEQFFGRDGIYGVPSEPDFLDNPRRFTFFSRAAFQLCRKLSWYPDVLHAHDWPTALVPVFLKYGERTGGFAKTISVLTIHNLGYQGIYSKDNYYYANLGWDVFYWTGFDDWNMMNILKAGINSADKLNTVSPTYAAETQTQAHGFRLDGVLRYRSGDYIGILNGIDTTVWNPQNDTYLWNPKQQIAIAPPYSRQDMKGKWKAKEALQREFNLPVDPDIPVIGMVTRLTEQKGVGELFGPAYGSAWSICNDMKLQLVLLGSGDAWCENEIKSLAYRLSNFKAHIGYAETESHLIEAGSDFFLMPSRYEPSGLNQMYSLAYGTLPIVRNTGGLADTVVKFNQDTGEGTGFMFDDLTPRAIYDTVGWAVWAYYECRSQIEKMRLTGMGQDFSWEKSAKQYLELYKKGLASV